MLQELRHCREFWKGKGRGRSQREHKKTGKEHMRTTICRVLHRAEIIKVPLPLRSFQLARRD
jgi:hypothetical protein